MANIDDLLTAIMGQTDTALNAPPAPWQQELLESVNPEKVKRQNIARALAKASTAMATTPGNFLSGISAAAATGADSYLTGRDQADDQRIKVQQLLGLQQQKDQDRRLGLLMDALGVQRNVLADNRAEESHKSQIERDRAYTDYYNRRGANGANSNLSEAQKQTNRRTARREIMQEKRRLQEMVNDGSLPPEEMNSQLDQFILDTNEYYGIDDTPGGAAPGDNISQVDLFSPRNQTPGGGTSEVLTPDQYETNIPQQRQQGILPPPPAAIDALRKNPDRRAEFDAKYGPGAAASILGN